MNSDHNSIWDRCLKVIQKNVNPESFKTWFQPIVPVGYEDDTLTIQVPNKYFYEFLEEHYVPVLRKSIRQEVGNDSKLQYQIRVKKNGAYVNQPLKNTSEGDLNVSLKQKQIANPFVIPGIKKQKVDSRLNPHYTFDNFIEGDCNRLARNAGVAVSDKPGLTSFNPLFIYGEVGLGKTHLAQAIGNAVVKKNPAKAVLYVSIEKFTNQIIHAIKQNNVNELVNFYQHLDVLIVDDIQFLKKKDKTQEIFFHIFNQLHQNRKQLVLTSDCQPKDMQGIRERLISRFKWGLNADLQAPDFETKIAILESKLDRDGLELSKDVVEFISYNIMSSIRELEGVLVSIVAQSELNNKDADMNLAKDVVSKFVSNISREITIENIQALVADHFDVSIELLKAKTRKREIVIARQLSMYLAKQLTEQPLTAIGKSFGGRDHTTVIYSCKAVKNQMDTNPEFYKTVQELEKKVRLSLH